MRISPFLLTALILITAIGVFSCKKAEPDPNKDNRLFICRVNGKEWKPKVDFCILCGSLPAQYVETSGERSMQLEARQNFTDTDSNKIYQIFRISASPIFSDNSVNHWTASFTNLYNGDCGNYRMDTTYSNVLKITRFDGVYRGIIKGEFEFRLVNENEDCTDTLLVTEGRFDLRTDI